MRDRRWVALLHSVVLGRGRRVEMAALRAMAEAVGVAKARTLVATGNLVFEADGSAAELEARLEAGFAARFERRVDIVVRSAEGWERLLAGCPFREAAEARPVEVHARVMRTPLAPEVAARLQAHRAGAEALAVVDGDLWLYLPHGAGGSRLAAAAGRPGVGTGTFRNWNTLRRIGAMLAG
jgi:uncharacterized protein (DUF1697 family)